MAKARFNPESVKKINGDIERVINGGEESISQTYDLLRSDIAELGSIVETIDNIRKSGERVPGNITDRAAGLDQRIRKLRKITSLYTNTKINDLKRRFVDIKEIVGNTLERGAVLRIRNSIIKLDAMAKNPDVDISDGIHRVDVELSGLENAISRKREEGVYVDVPKRMMVKVDVRARDTAGDARRLGILIAEWKKVRVRINKNGLSKIRPGSTVAAPIVGRGGRAGAGAMVFTMGHVLELTDKGSALIEFSVDIDGSGGRPRTMIVKREVPIANLLTEDVAWVDAQIHSLQVYHSRGENIRKRIESVWRKVSNLKAVSRGMAKLPTYSDALAEIRLFDKTVQEKAEAPITHAGIDALKYEHSQILKNITAKAAAQWSGEERKKYADAVRRSWEHIRDLSEKRRKANPKKTKKAGKKAGTNVSGKTKAVKSRGAGRSARRSKRNPSDAMDSRRQIARCRMLWEVYCANQNRKTLRDLFEHLKVMDGSASKRVLEERSRCLRVAMNEARRIGLQS